MLSTIFSLGSGAGRGVGGLFRSRAKARLEAAKTLERDALRAVDAAALWQKSCAETLDGLVTELGHVSQKCNDFEFLYGGGIFRENDFNYYPRAISDKTSKLADKLSELHDQMAEVSCLEFEAALRKLSGEIRHVVNYARSGASELSRFCEPLDVVAAVRFRLLS